MKNIFIKDDELDKRFEKPLLFHVNEDKKYVIQKESDYYLIQSIVKIKSIEYNDKKFQDIILNNDKISFEIDFDIFEKENRDYSFNERKQDIENDLISLFNCYNNDKKIKDINDIIKFIKNIIHKKFDRSSNNYLDFLLNENFIFPNWILPEIEVYKDTYLNEDPMGPEVKYI